jgi:hypothetical protein
VFTDELRRLGAFVVLKPRPAIAPVPTGVPLPGDARVPVASFILGDRAPAWCHVTEALGAVLTLG